MPAICGIAQSTRNRSTRAMGPVADVRSIRRCRIIEIAATISSAHTTSPPLPGSPMRTFPWRPARRANPQLPAMAKSAPPIVNPRSA